MVIFNSKFVEISVKRTENLTFDMSVRGFQLRENGNDPQVLSPRDKIEINCCMTE